MFNVSEINKRNIVLKENIKLLKSLFEVTRFSSSDYSYRYIFSKVVRDLKGYSENDIESFIQYNSLEKFNRAKKHVVGNMASGVNARIHKELRSVALSKINDINSISDKILYNLVVQDN